MPRTHPSPCTKGICGSPMTINALVYEISSSILVVQETVRYEVTWLVILGVVIVDCPGISKEDSAFG